MNNTPKKTHADDNASLKDFVENDAISAGSLDSNASIYSHHSASLVQPNNETDETVTVIDTEAEAQPDQSEQSLDQPTIDRLPVESIKLDDSTDSIKSRDISIGSIYDQFLIEFVVRLVCYKFLLNGHDQKLKLDNVVRVSIKNVSLIVLSHCVRMYPQILLMKLTVPQKRIIVSDDCREKMFDDLSELCLAEQSECRDHELLLDIKTDHFGTSTTSLDDFLSPLSDSGANQSKSVHELPKVTAAVIDNSFATESSDVEVDRFDQNVEDILLYFNHDDPSLRGNVQSIIGHFIVAVLNDYRSLDEFRETFFCSTEIKFINYDLLLKVLMKVRLDMSGINFVHTSRADLFSIHPFRHLRVENNSGSFFGYRDFPMKFIPS